jgi:hypothetical protein
MFCGNREKIIVLLNYSVGGDVSHEIVTREMLL